MLSGACLMVWRRFDRKMPVTLRKVDCVDLAWQTPSAAPANLCGCRPQHPPCDAVSCISCRNPRNSCVESLRATDTDTEGRLERPLRRGTGMADREDERQTRRRRRRQLHPQGADRRGPPPPAPGAPPRRHGDRRRGPALAGAGGGAHALGRPPPPHDRHPRRCRARPLADGRPGDVHGPRRAAPGPDREAQPGFRAGAERQGLLERSVLGCSPARTARPPRRADGRARNGSRGSRHWPAG